jgi:spore germination protein KC
LAGNEDSIYLCIYDGDPKKFIDAQLREERLTGLYLFGLIGNNDAIAVNSAKLDINEFLARYALGGHVNALPVVAPAEAEERDGYDIKGIALLKDCKLIGVLEGDAPKYYNMMLDNVVTGLLAVPNPNQPEKMLTVQIAHYQQGVKLEYDARTLSCTKKIDVTANLSEVQGPLSVDDESLNKIGGEIRRQIADNCMTLFEEYKQKGIDIFGIQEAFDREYPQYRGRDIIADTDLTMDIIVSIQGTTTKWGQ